MREKRDLPVKTAHSIISKHVAGITRRNAHHQFKFQFKDKDNRKVLPAEHLHAPLLFTVAAALTCTAVL